MTNAAIQRVARWRRARSKRRLFRIILVLSVLVSVVSGVNAFQLRALNQRLHASKTASETVRCAADLVQEFGDGGRALVSRYAGTREYVLFDEEHDNLLVFDPETSGVAHTSEFASCGAFWFEAITGGFDGFEITDTPLGPLYIVRLVGVETYYGVVFDSSNGYSCPTTYDVDPETLMWI